MMDGLGWTESNDLSGVARVIERDGG